jgi:putative DNA-invertase from lambdoid prophage Rac
MAAHLTHEHPSVFCSAAKVGPLFYARLPKAHEHLGVGFVSLNEALDLTTSSGRAMAALLAVFAAFEREILQERVCAGLAHARQNGKKLVRPATVAPHTAQIRRLHRAGVSKAETARRLRVGSTPVRRILK